MTKSVKRASFAEIALLIACAAFIHGCEIDHGLGPMKSRITGDVLFFNEKPDFVESVRVIAVVRWDPENLSLGDVVFTNTSINLSAETSPYYIPAPITSYELVAAIWKEKGAPWNYLNILGFYGFDPINHTVEYRRVVLTEEKPVAHGIDIICDWTLVKPNGAGLRLIEELK